MFAPFPQSNLQPAHYGPYLAEKVINCQRCKFVHLHPLPDAATVARYYEGDYFYSGESPHSPPDWFIKERSEYEAGLWDAYYNYLAGLLDPDKPVIDWGCGAGWLLHYLCKHDWSQWKLYGIEPSATARRVSPIGHRLFAEMPKMLTKPSPVAYRQAVKGNVILALTLEHILNPEQFLKEQILPHLDGRLVVVVPNEWNPLQSLVNNRSRGSKRDWFVSSVHLNYFSRKSLKGLLERAGLRVTHTGATYPIELNIILGRDYRGDDDLGRKCHLDRLKLEQRWPGMFRLYGYLGRWFGVGRELVMVGER